MAGAFPPTPTAPTAGETKRSLNRCPPAATGPDRRRHHASGRTDLVPPAPTTGVDKQAIRERVWDDLEGSGVARFPFPP